MQSNVVKFPSEEGTIALFTTDTDEGILQMVKVTLTIAVTTEPMSPEDLAKVIECAKDIIHLARDEKSASIPLLVY